MSTPIAKVQIETNDPDVTVDINGYEQMILPKSILILSFVALLESVCLYLMVNSM